jgi:FkbM family methyltransferase
MDGELYERTSRWTPVWLKELVRKAATRAGCHLGRLPGVEVLGSHLLTVFTQLNVNCVLDVGAHVGQYGRFLRNIGYRGEIVSFEPVSANFAILEKRCEGDEKWRAFRLALGHETGTEPINVARITQFSSFLSPNRYSHDQYGGFSDVDRIETVEMTRLDRVFDECTSRVADPRVFLKLDTQGYDLNVLRGAGACLSRIVALQSELSVKPIYEGMTDYVAAMSCMNRMGFELTAVFPVNREQHLQIVEFDSIMVASAARHSDPS